jgi:hypothetical protein
LDYATELVLYSKVESLASKPQHRGPGLSVFRSSSDRRAQLYPQATDSFFLASFDSQICKGGNGMKVFEDRVLRCSAPKKYVRVGGWRNVTVRILQKKKKDLRNLYSSTNVIRIIK